MDRRGHTGARSLALEWGTGKEHWQGALARGTGKAQWYRRGGQEGRCSRQPGGWRPADWRKRRKEGGDDGEQSRQAKKGKRREVRRRKGEGGGGNSVWHRHVPREAGGGIDMYLVGLVVAARKVVARPGVVEAAVRLVQRNEHSQLLPAPPASHARCREGETLMNRVGLRGGRHTRLLR